MTAAERAAELRSDADKLEAAGNAEQAARYRAGAEGILAAETPTMPRRYTFRELRVVSNVTRGYDGGHSVELRDGSVIAGPFAAKVDAVEAKRKLVAGEPLTLHAG